MKKSHFKHFKTTDKSRFEMPSIGGHEIDHVSHHIEGLTACQGI